MPFSCTIAGLCACCDAVRRRSIVVHDGELPLYGATNSVLPAGEIVSRASLWPDCARLRNSGLVLESDYAARYLGSAKLAHLSVPHYLTIGERLGYRPNPFFDPHSFSDATGGTHRSLLEYLDHY